MTNGVTDQPTAPDLDALMMLIRHLGPDGARVARWRITAPDWAVMRAQAARYPYSPIHPPAYGQLDEEWTLFGIPVDVIPPQRHRWPELVLISDRRVALPG